MEEETRYEHVEPMTDGFHMCLPGKYSDVLEWGRQEISKYIAKESEIKSKEEDFNGI